MSLNRAGQAVHDYIARHPEELRHWRDKVARLASAAPDPHAAADAVADGLADYCRERAGAAVEFRDLAAPNRLMLRSLAELYLRQWGPPRAKKSVPATQM